MQKRRENGFLKKKRDGEVSKNKRSFWKKINFFLLKKDIRALGYEYPWYSLLGILAGILVLCFFIGKFYQLQMKYSLILAMVMALFTPEFIRRHYERKYQYQRFTDAANYMEQMMYAFKNTPKIHDCLMDVLELYPSGEMKNCIKEALHIIQHGKYSTEEGEKDINHLSLSCIQKHYPNNRMEKIHEFMCQVDVNGGDYDLSMDILLQDRNNWVKSMEKHRHNLLSERRKIFIASGIVMVLSAVPNYMISRLLPSELQIGTLPFYNIVNLFSLILLILIIVFADKKLSKDWLDSKYHAKQKNMENLYKNTINWNRKKEWKTSLLLSIIPSVLFLFCMVQKFLPGIVGSSFLLVFFLNQHKIGHGLNVKNITKYLKMEFPGWLLQISLYLQTDSVKVAIYHSLLEAPDILKPALKKLVEELEKHPESSKPYLSFLDYFDIPEVKSSMKMLYAISSTGSGEIKEQIVNIIGRTNDMVLKAEELKQEDELAGMMALMLAPSLPMILMFITGLVAFILVFFSMNLI